MIQIDPIRLARQEECIDKWDLTGRNGIGDIYPGTGKTFIAILAIQRCDKDYRGIYVISVPNDIIYKQWVKTIQTFPVHLKNRIILKTKGTLLSEGIVYKDIALFIIDEIHEYTSEKSEGLLNKSIVQHKAFLGLTGTTNHDKFRNVLKHYKIFDTISEHEAKSKGFVAEMIEYNLGLTLTKKEEEAYVKISDYITKLMSLFDNNLKKAEYICYGGVNPTNGVRYPAGEWVMAMAMQKGWNKNLDTNIPAHKELDDKYNPSRIISNANLLLQLVNRRKKQLAEMPSKEQAVLALLKKFTNTKTIIFSESTVFASKVGLLLNSNNIPTAVFHSKIKTEIRVGKQGKPVKFGAVRLKREAIEGITSGKYKAISVTKALDKGLDIPDLRFSIITSGTTSIDQEVQRKSRTGRKEADNDDPVLNVNIYIKHTQDEVWLRSRQKGNNTSPIFVDRIEDISYKPQPNYFNVEDL